jgi:MFS family permease
MSAVAETTAEHAADDRLARRNAMVLAVAQALAGGNAAVLVATGGLVGAMLAPDKGLATVPISVYVVGTWMGTLPVGALAQRYGRRTAFQIGTLFGVLTGLICCAAVLIASFWLFNLGALFCGFYAAATQAYRFAAADTASEAFKPKAISW